jgi:hypothetical protein
MSYQNIGQNHNIKKDPLKYVKFEYMAVTITYKSNINEEVKSRINSGNR